MTNRTAPFEYIIQLGENYHNAATGEMQIRFLHDSTSYNVNHVLRLNFIEFIKEQTVESVVVDIYNLVVPAVISAIDEVPESVLLERYEGDETVLDYLRLTRAVLIGRDRGTRDAPAFESADGSKVRVSGVVNANGVRSAVTTVDRS